MADSKNSGQGATAAPQQEAPKTGDKAAPNDSVVFSSVSVALLLHGLDEDRSRLHALLSGIRAMLDRDEQGDYENPNIAILVDMAEDIVGDVSHLKPFTAALKEAAL
jgi:hypothetical protein